MKIKSILMAVLLVVAVAFTGMALAATPNPSPASPGYTPMVVPIMGVYSSNQTVLKFKAPTGYRVVHASATAGSVTGTDPTLTINLKSGTNSMFSSPISVAAGTITDATLATTPNIVDESTVSIDFAKGGSYSTGQGWKDITLFLLLKRR